MTQEELQKAYDDLVANNATLQAEKEKLEANEKNQNSYITKLESKVKTPEATLLPPSLSDKNLAEYLQRNMRRDTIEEAMSTIKENVPADVIECLMPEVTAFLNKTMTIEKTKPSFVIDAFNLIYGSSLSNKSHAIHKLKEQQAEPIAPQPLVSTPTTTSTQQKNVSDLSNRLRDFMNPPSMTPNDINAAQTPPSNQVPIANTKDAIKAFKEKLTTSGGSRFS